MRLRTKAQLLEEALARPSRVQGEVPTSAIRDMRGSRSQRSVALERGTSQALISELEVGTRKLTLKAAGRLAPALGATLEQLMAAEQVGVFNRREENASRERRGALREIEAIEGAIDVNERPRRAFPGAQRDRKDVHGRVQLK